MVRTSIYITQFPEMRKGYEDMLNNDFTGTTANPDDSNNLTFEKLKETAETFQRKYPQSSFISLVPAEVLNYPEIKKAIENPACVYYGIPLNAVELQDWPGEPGLKVMYTPDRRKDVNEMIEQREAALRALKLKEAP